MVRILKATLFISLSILASCNNGPEISSVELPLLSGESLPVLDRSSKASVYVFMAPDCPLCINYSLVVRELEDEFSDQDVAVNLVFPGTSYSQDTIEVFLNRHKLNSTVYLDPEFQLVHLLNVKVTPEAVLVNDKGETQYRGAIDDWVYGTGLRKQQISRRYLRDAIIKVLNGHEPDTAYVRAYGCYIELI